MYSPLKKVSKVLTYGLFMAATSLIGLVFGSNRDHKTSGGFSLPSVPTAHADVPVGSGDGSSGGDGCAGCAGSGDGTPGSGDGSGGSGDSEGGSGDGGSGDGGGTGDGSGGSGGDGGDGGG